MRNKISIRRTGSRDRVLFGPEAAIMSSNNSITVSDLCSSRISVFTMKCVFLHHLLTEISNPLPLSFFEPYQYVKHYTDGKAGLY